MTDPTPLKGVPLSGYIAEIQRLTSERDALEKALRALEIKLDWNADDLDYAQFKEMESIIDNALNRLERKDNG